MALCGSSSTSILCWFTFFFSSRRRHTRSYGDWSSDVCSSDLLQQRLLAKQRSSPVLTECNPALFEFAPVEGRQVVAAFDGGAITSDAGALLLGETDRAIRLSERFASCFTDARMAELVEHEVHTMVLQRVIGIALGY